MIDNTSAEYGTLSHLSQVRSPEKKVNIYLQACREIQYSRPMDALEYANTARSIARRHKLKERELHSRRMMAICYYADHQFDEALQLFKKTIPGYRKLHDASGQARTLQNIGMTLRAMGKNEEALLAYRESQLLLGGIGEDHVLCAVLTNIGSTYTVMELPKEALEAFSECLAIAERLNLVDVRARIMGNIADIYNNIGDIDTSAEWSRQSVALHRENDDQMGVGLTLANIGRLNLNTGDLDSALAAYSESLTVISSLGDDHLRARTMIGLADLFFRKKNYDRAIDMASEAQQIFSEAKDHEREIRCMIQQSKAMLAQQATNDAKKMILSAHKALASTDNISIHADVLITRGAIALDEGAKKSAVAFLRKALAIAKNSQMSSLIAEIHRNLSMVYAAGEDWKKALEEERQASTAQREADGATRARHSQALEMKLAIAQSSRERERVQADRDRLRSELELRERELNTQALAIAQKNELLSDLSTDITSTMKNVRTNDRSKLKDLQGKIESHRRTGEDWKRFSEQLASVHEGFVRELSTICPNLSPSELRVASLLKIDLSSKEVAEVLSLGLQTVEVYRHRLRKKLLLDSSVSLSTYLQSIQHD